MGGRCLFFVTALLLVMLTACRSTRQVSVAEHREQMVEVAEVHDTAEAATGSAEVQTVKIDRHRVTELTDEWGVRRYDTLGRVTEERWRRRVCREADTTRRRDERLEVSALYASRRAEGVTMRREDKVVSERMDRTSVPLPALRAWPMLWLVLWAVGAGVLLWRIYLRFRRASG